MGDLDRLVSRRASDRVRSPIEPWPQERPWTD